MSDRRPVPIELENFETFEIPLFFGPGIPNVDQWTLMVAMPPTPDEDVFTGIIFNGNTQRGVFLRKYPPVRMWQLQLFDSDPYFINPKAVRLAALKFQEIVGSRFSVIFDLSCANLSAPA